MNVKLIFAYGFVIGGICFLLGFVGPIIITPDANQCPLLGIFITGPLGFILGIILEFIFFFIRKRNPNFKDRLQKLIDKQ